MKNKLKSIRSIGIALIAVSSLTIISSLFGLLYWIDFITEKASNFDQVPYESHMLSFAKPIAVISLTFGLGFLVVGIFITLYKNWARVLAQVLAVLYLINFWYQAIFIAPYNPFDKGEIGIDQVLGALLWSVPFILLIRYLNKDKVKSHFA
ncbi:hypothetical protein [Pontibacter mangrovi]|uniref:DUF2569 domain-containing protein n=1 Tax=Pontibacter mangrovi TaxID=2589816 RepID=A0A501W615_9BACT|nr:hypothetical protein [Pontibacter mangrovi]TPE44728.1 hypothetical protein FJM65_06805 [Pontibacter mangrovi]